MTFSTLTATPMCENVGEHTSMLTLPHCAHPTHMSIVWALYKRSIVVCAFDEPSMCSISAMYEPCMGVVWPSTAAQDTHIPKILIMINLVKLIINLQLILDLILRTLHVKAH